MVETPGIKLPTRPKCCETTVRNRYNPPSGPLAKKGGTTKSFVPLGGGIIYFKKECGSDYAAGGICNADNKTK
jgi:hypothetical protein